MSEANYYLELRQRVLAQLCASAVPPCSQHVEEADAVVDIVRELNGDAESGIGASRELPGIDAARVTA